jgi:hypothetical protein
MILFQRFILLSLAAVTGCQYFFAVMQLFPAPGIYKVMPLKINANRW